MKYNVGAIILVILVIVGLFYVFQLDDEHKKTDQTDTAQQPKTNDKVVHPVKELSVPTEHINERTTITFSPKKSVGVPFIAIFDGYMKKSTEIKGFTKGKAILIVVENKIDSMTATIIGAIPMPIDASIRALIKSETDDPIARSVVKKTLTSKGKGYTGFTVEITIEDDSGETGQSKEIEDFPVGSSIVIGFHNKDDPTVKRSTASFTMPVDATIRELIDRMEDDR